MTSNLLITKLKFPNSNMPIISRQHLYDRLNKGLDSKLTLVSAPAGFGKTTLVSSWITRSKRPSAWLSLDQDDNDPFVFITYLISAIQVIFPTFGASVLIQMGSAQRPSLNTLFFGLLNEVHQTAAPFNLVLDDYHKIENIEIHKNLRFFVENCPTPLNFILISRADPSWPIAKLRADGGLVEIRSNHLRFTDHESLLMLKELGVNITNEDSEILAEKIEGWVVGLQMVALSLKEPGKTSDLIRSFKGTNRYILDYLIEEVLDNQPHDFKEFLYKTSILKQMNSSLCDHLLEKNNSSEILDILEKKNLFLVNLDDEKGWVRYHNLFSDLLQNKLKQTFSKNEITSLHARASDWYGKNNFTNEAMNHSIKAGDSEKIIDLVEKQSFTMLDKGELFTLLNWIDALPAGSLKKSPWIHVAYCWGLQLTQDFRSAKKQLEELKTEHLHLDEAIEGHIAAINIPLEDGFSNSVEYANIALEKLPKNANKLRAHVMRQLGEILLSVGEINDGRSFLRKASALALEVGDIVQAVVSLSSLGVSHFWQGELQIALNIYNDALIIANDSSASSWKKYPQVASVYFQLSLLYHAWFDLKTAKEFADTSYKYLIDWGHKTFLIDMGITIADICISLGEFDQADTYIQEAKRLAQSTGHIFWMDKVSCWEVELNSILGKKEKVKKWVEIMLPSLETDFTFSQRYLSLSLAKALITIKKPELAIPIMERLLIICEPRGINLFSIQAHILMSIAYQSQKLEIKAISCLEKALQLAMAEKIIWPFIRGGVALEALLQKVLEQGIFEKFVSRLLNNFKANNAYKLSDPLSKRELEVFRLLTTTMSASEIADHLFLSAGTVRTHIKAVYNKLDVHRRREAIEKGRKFGILK